MNQRIPVIDCTDLYHPHQDVGDNFDLVLPYALNEEIDLRAKNHANSEAVAEMVKNMVWLQ